MNKTTKPAAEWLTGVLALNVSLGLIFAGGCQSLSTAEWSMSQSGHFANAGEQVAAPSDQPSSGNFQSFSIGDQPASTTNAPQSNRLDRPAPVTRMPFRQPSSTEFPKIRRAGFDAKAASSKIDYMDRKTQPADSGNVHPLTASAKKTGKVLREFSSRFVSKFDQRQRSTRRNHSQKINPVFQSAQQRQFQQARQMELQGQLRQAIDEYESLRESGYRNVQLDHRLAVAYDKIGLHDRSLPLYRAALQVDPANVELLCDYGFRWYLLGNLAEAENAYLAGLQVAPKHARTHNNLGMIMSQSNRIQQAAEHFRFAGLSPAQIRHNIEVSERSISVAEIENDRFAR